MSSREVRRTGPSVTKFGISRKIFVKVHNTKFHRNPSSGGSADIYVDGRIDRQDSRRTNMTEIIGALCDHANGD